jgi:hypothetical protein
MSYGQMMHNLVLTRFLVAASSWARRSGDFKIAEMRTCYDLDPGAAKVVPDAWILFENVGKSLRPAGTGKTCFRCFWRLTGVRNTSASLKSMFPGALRAP